jgi:disulfide bond formation protein DsbB
MFDTLLALGTIALQIFVVIIIIAWIAKKQFVEFIGRHATIILRGVFVASVVGSLIYSEIFDFAPCILCWYQRLAIFPIALLLFTSTLQKSALLRLQVLIFSSVGFAIALFHRYIELFPGAGTGVCGPDGVACDTLYVLQFGYITIPMMSVTVLGLSILLTLLAGRFPQSTIAQNS